MIKVFTTNKNGKIELTEKELKSILDDAYWEGYRANSHSYVYTTPGWSPFNMCTTTGVSGTTTVTLNSNSSVETASTNTQVSSTN